MNKSDLAKENYNKGRLSEDLYKIILEDIGKWKVERLFETKAWYIKDGKLRKPPAQFFREEEVKNFFKETKREHLAGEIVKKLIELNKEGHSLPDFICKRNGFVKFVEVKNSKYEIDPNEISQIKAINELKNNFNIETDIIHLPLELEKESNELKAIKVSAPKKCN